MITGTRPPPLVLSVEDSSSVTITSVFAISVLLPSSPERFALSQLSAAERRSDSGHEAPPFGQSCPLWRSSGITNEYVGNDPALMSVANCDVETMFAF